MASQPKQKPNLRELDYSPNRNPLIASEAVEIKRRYVRSGQGRDLVDPVTGEVSGVTAVHTVEWRDQREFVKVFSDGIKAAYGLNKTAYRVFQLILEEYENTNMAGGYAEAVYLAWFDGGLSGRNVGMTDRTFHNGLKELLSKGFLAPKAPNLYWTNPSLFFKGDRVAFIREYRRRSSEPEESDRADLERRGQQRIDYGDDS